MKKIISLLVVLLILCGCNQKPKPDFNSGFSIDTYRCDMSAYKGLTSVNHNYLGVTVADVKKTIDEKGYGAFVLSRKNCEHCQLLMQYLNKAAEELGVYVYYLDGKSDVYPIVNTPDYDLLDELLKPIEEELDGELALQTPHFFTIVNGEFIDSYVGVDAKDVDNPTDKEVEAIINKYKKSLEIFVE